MQLLLSNPEPFSPCQCLLEADKHVKANCRLLANAKIKHNLPRIHKDKTISLTLEQHGFELHESTYTWIFFSKHSSL